ncbi:hypothetical protein D3C72_2010920 [compost metagenome]
MILNFAVRQNKRAFPLLACENSSHPQSRVKLTPFCRQALIDQIPILCVKESHALFTAALFTEPEVPRVLFITDIQGVHAVHARIQDVAISVFVSEQIQLGKVLNLALIDFRDSEII